MESSSAMVPFPLLIAPIESTYRPCTIPYRFASDPPHKPTPTELAWIEVFRNSIPSFRMQMQQAFSFVELRQASSCNSVGVSRRAKNFSRRNSRPGIQSNGMFYQISFKGSISYLHFRSDGCEPAQDAAPISSSYESLEESSSISDRHGQGQQSSG